MHPERLHHCTIRPGDLKVDRLVLTSYCGLNKECTVAVETYLEAVKVAKARQPGDNTTLVGLPIVTLATSPLREFH